MLIEFCLKGKFKVACESYLLQINTIKSKVESSIRIIRWIQRSFNHATQPEWSSGSNEVGLPADPACPT